MSVIDKIMDGEVKEMVEIKNKYSTALRSWRMSKGISKTLDKQFFKFYFINTYIILILMTYFGNQGKERSTNSEGGKNKPCFRSPCFARLNP